MEAPTHGLLSSLQTSANINASTGDSREEKTNHNARTSTRCRDIDSLIPCSLLQRGAASGTWNGSFSLDEHHSLRRACVTTRFHTTQANASISADTRKRKNSEPSFNPDFTVK